ncbi:hypothetical protein B566_EDAN017416, partial [Ephemera danica]
MSEVSDYDYNDDYNYEVYDREDPWVDPPAFYCGFHIALDQGKTVIPQPDEDEFNDENENQQQKLLPLQNVACHLMQKQRNFYTGTNTENAWDMSVVAIVQLQGKISLGQDGSIDQMFHVGIRDVYLDHHYIGCPQFQQINDVCCPTNDKIKNIWNHEQPDNQNVTFKSGTLTSPCGGKQYFISNERNMLILNVTDSRFLLHKKWACQHSTKNKLSVSRRNVHCKATLDVHIKKVNKGTRKNDIYLKRDVPLCCVIEVSNQHTHNTNVADSMKYLRMSPETKEDYLNYFDDGLSPSQAIRLHTSKIMLQDNGHVKLADASVNPCSKSVYTLYSNWSEKNYGVKSDPLQKVKEKMEFYSSRGAEVMLEEEGSTFAALVATPTMKRAQQLPCAKEIIFLDSTSSCDITQVTVTTVNTVTKAGAIPICVLFHSHQTQENYKMAFNLLKKKYPCAFGGCENPQAFMTDDSLAERNALKTVWPQSQRLLCKFHVLQAEWRWLCSNEKATMRQKLIHMFKKVLNAGSEKDMNEAAQEFEKIKESNRKFYKRFQNFYLRREEWVPILYSNTVVTRNNHTNNYSEACIRVLKDIVLCRMKAFNLTALIDFTVTVWEEYFCKRILEVAYNRCRRNELLYNSLCSKVSNVDEKSVLKIGEDLFQFPAASNKSQYYTVDVAIGICSCFSGKFGGFCKHQSWLHSHYNIPLPNAPPVSSNDRFELGKLALGDKCPNQNFFRDMRDTIDVSITSPQMEEPPSQQTEILDSFLEDAEEIDMSTNENNNWNKAITDTSDELNRIFKLTKGQPNATSLVEKLYATLKSIKNPSQALCAIVAFRSAVTSTNRRGARIHTQPTAAARRRDGVSRGCRPIPMGRPTKHEVSRRVIKKRPRNISLAISQN